MNTRKRWLIILLLLVAGCARRPPAMNTKIYDESADARRDIAAAVTQAEGSAKNVVLIFGANW